MCVTYELKTTMIQKPQAVDYIIVIYKWNESKRFANELMVKMVAFYQMVFNFNFGIWFNCDI